MARPPNSWVWEHFRQNILEQTSSTHTSVVCQICNKILRYSSRNGPTNLARHLIRSHNVRQPDSHITRRPFESVNSPKNLHDSHPDINLSINKSDNASSIVNNNDSSNNMNKDNIENIKNIGNSRNSQSYNRLREASTHNKNHELQNKKKDRVGINKMPELHTSHVIYSDGVKCSKNLGSDSEIDAVTLKHSDSDLNSNGDPKSYNSVNYDDGDDNSINFKLKKINKSIRGSQTQFPVLASASEGRNNSFNASFSNTPKFKDIVNRSQTNTSGVSAGISETRSKKNITSPLIAETTETIFESPKIANKRGHTDILLSTELLTSSTFTQSPYNKSPNLNFSGDMNKKSNKKINYEQFTKNVNLLPVYRLNVKHKNGPPPYKRRRSYRGAKSAASKGSISTNSTDSSNVVSPLLPSQKFNQSQILLGQDGYSGKVYHDHTHKRLAVQQVSPYSLRLPALNSGVITSLGSSSTPSKPYDQIEQQFFNNQQTYISPLSGIGDSINDNRVMSRENVSIYNNVDINTMFNTNLNAIDDNSNDFTSIQHGLAGQCLTTDVSDSNLRLQKERKAIGNVDFIKMYGKNKRISVNNEGSPNNIRSAPSYNTPQNLMQNVGPEFTRNNNMQYRPNDQQSQLQQLRLQLQLQRQQQHLEQMGPLEQVGEMDQIERMEINRIGRINRLDQFNQIDQSFYRYGGHKSISVNTSTNQFADQQTGMLANNEHGTEFETEMNAPANEITSSKKTLGNLLNIIEFLQGSIVNLESELGAQRMKVLRLEQNIARGINERRGSGCDVPYDILPFIGDSKELPPLRNAFMIFDLNDYQIQKYLELYGISNISFLEVKNDRDEMDFGNAERQPNDINVATSNEIRKNNDKNELDTNKNNHKDNNECNNDIAEINEINEINDTNNRNNRDNDNYINNSEIDLAGNLRKEKIKKLCKFVGCSDMEKYWKIYLKN